MAFKRGWGLFLGSSIHVPNNSKHEKSNEKENQTNEYSLIILQTLGECHFVKSLKSLV